MYYDGTTPYIKNVGDIVRLHNEDYYVISMNGEANYATLLKAEPLTVDEVNLYGAGHINRYTLFSVGTAKDIKGYGGMAYYGSETCGYVNGSYVKSGCTNDYNKSEVKYVVDNWMNDKFNPNELAIDVNGYKARLLAAVDLGALGYRYLPDTDEYESTGVVPTWVYRINWSYWTMVKRFNGLVFKILPKGNLDAASLYDYNLVVRPVVNIYKSKL